MKNFVKSFWNNEDGAELAEYAVAVALLVAIGVAVYQTLGTGINTANGETGDAIEAAAGGTFTP